MKAKEEHRYSPKGVEKKLTYEGKRYSSRLKKERKLIIGRMKGTWSDDPGTVCMMGASSTR